MRKFKFIGTEQERLDYSTKEKSRPQRDKVYRADDYVGNSPIIYWFSSGLIKHEWQEVFDEEKVQLTETEKIVLIDFLNDHFEEFWHFVGSSKTTDYRYWEMLKGEAIGQEIVSSRETVSNIIDKIERL